MRPWLRKKTWMMAAVFVAILVVARVAIPITPAGDWMGPLTECACRMYSFNRFQNGRIVIYGHGGEPTDSMTDIGAYTRVSWNVYRWDAPWNKTGPITVRPGWLFTRYEGVHGGKTTWCWRYPLFIKANRIVRESEALAAAKSSKKRLEDDFRIR